ncbi:hypothetical protein ACP275_06G003100 [Erythranthe tilingii]
MQQNIVFVMITGLIVQGLWHGLIQDQPHQFIVPVSNNNNSKYWTYVPGSNNSFC